MTACFLICGLLRIVQFVFRERKKLFDSTGMDRVNCSQYKPIFKLRSDLHSELALVRGDRSMRALTREPTISKRVAIEIRTAILDGSLPPESPIHQEKLAAKLGVSREPVRKALVLLEQEGLVNIVGRSAIVTTVDDQFIAEIYGFREVVEGYVAAMVAGRRDYDTTKLREILASGYKSVGTKSVDRLIELDQAFHNELYRASGNRVVIEVMETQWNHIHRAMITDLSMDSFQKQSWDEHAGIVDAILNRQSSRARTLASAHIRSALARKVARLKTQQRTP
jgi:DNA-binding GntR family transcriptional regulator